MNCYPGYSSTTLIEIDSRRHFKFENGVIGKALKGPICTYEFSAGISTDFSPVTGQVAVSVAHMMGHNFGKLILFSLFLKLPLKTIARSPAGLQQLPVKRVSRIRNTL